MTIPENEEKNVCSQSMSSATATIKTFYEANKIFQAFKISFKYIFILKRGRLKLVSSIEICCLSR